ncbi:major facilitator superfamily domain-containing protein [Schizophyllum amplum]|uniref:Major facilitator superfamily domain-containing protein n=1 Tax=Schizophyllum amplum TaxID=97359 RepID=A0A550CBM0_9AGAR|nr:major facilitator superfamily domain-containing protein [Auriculariopsis ampla]
MASLASHALDVAALHPPPSVHTSDKAKSAQLSIAIDDSAVDDQDSVDVESQTDSLRYGSGHPHGSDVQVHATHLSDRLRRSSALKDDHHDSVARVRCPSAVPEDRPAVIDFAKGVIVAEEAVLTSDRTRRPSAYRQDTFETLDTKHFEPDTQPPSRTSTLAPVLPQLEFSEDAPQGRSKWRSKKWRTAQLHVASFWFAMFVEGWNDGTTGPLLPVIQETYKISFFIVSLLFVANCIGFLSGTFLNVWLDEKIGLGKAILLGALVQLAAYAMIAPTPPFPVMVVAYGMAGFGMSFQNAHCNGFIGSLQNPFSKLGVLHATYGLGAFAAPLASTWFATQRHWSFHFLISTGLALLNVFSLLFVLRGKRQEVLMAEGGVPTAERQPSTDNRYKAMMSIRAVNLLACFALIYTGTEVTLGGWIVTFIINKRGGGETAGYISSGFFGGLTVGRLALIWVNKKVGEYRVLFMYLVISIGLEITIWFVPSIIENGIAVSLVGVLLGPMFPILLGQATRVVPKVLLTPSVGFIAGIAMVGSALLPFATGVLSSQYGIGALQPFVVSMMCLMFALWCAVPGTSRRND